MITDGEKWPVLRSLYSAANDPQTANDLQNGPQVIPDR